MSLNMAEADSRDARIERLERAVNEERGRREALEARLRLGGRRLVLALGVAALFGVAFGGVRAALAAPNCMQTLPAPLVTFCAGAPALAADVNGNFNTLATSLIAKVGPFNSVDATMNLATMKGLTVNGTSTVNGPSFINGNETVSGTMKAATGSVTGNLTVSGKLLVGYHVVFCNGVFCACPAGEVLLGGGGRCQAGSTIISSQPGTDLNGNPAWGVNCLPTNNAQFSQAICARLAL